MCLRTTEAVIKMIIKRKESYNETRFQNHTELLLIGCLIESTWTQKIQIKYIDTKNRLADIGGGEKREQKGDCTDDSGTIVHFRALQGHSGRIPIDPSLQDNLIIQSGFFQHIFHIVCGFNHQLWINTWRSKFEQETDSIVPAC